MSLEPLRCPSCNAPVPLGGATRFACPYCRADVDVPASYRELFRLNALEADAHRALAARYAEVATPPPRRLDAIAIALVVIAPAVAAAVWTAVAAKPVSMVTVFAAAIVPALMPGTGLWMWTAAIHATIVRFQLALAAVRTGDGPTQCRQCGAPLALADGAIFARCAYCGTDSLTSHVAEASAQLDAALRAELRTLDQAVTALRVRRRLVIGGVLIAVIVLAGVVGAVVVAAARHA